MCTEQKNQTGSSLDILLAVVAVIAAILLRCLFSFLPDEARDIGVPPEHRSAASNGESGSFYSFPFRVIRFLRRNA